METPPDDIMIAEPQINTRKLLLERVDKIFKFCYSLRMQQVYPSWHIALDGLSNQLTWLESYKDFKSDIEEIRKQLNRVYIDFSKNPTDARIRGAYYGLLHDYEKALIKVIKKDEGGN